MKTLRLRRVSSGNWRDGWGFEANNSKAEESLVTAYGIVSL